MPGVVEAGEIPVLYLDAPDLARVPPATGTGDEGR